MSKSPEQITSRLRVVVDLFGDIYDGEHCDRAGNPPPSPCGLKTQGGHVCGNWPTLDEETGLWRPPGCWECY